MDPIVDLIIQLFFLIIIFYIEGHVVEQLIVMIRLSSKKILISTCLVLALVSGIMMQIVGQSTLSVTVCSDLEFDRFEVLINGEPFCILLSEAPVGIDGSVQLNGEVFEGTCHDPGNLIGTFTGTLIFEEGTLDDFIVIIDFNVTRTNGILHSKSKFAGSIVGGENASATIFESEYAYFESNGVRVNLDFVGLEPENGTLALVENEVSLICLPTFIFSASVETPVGGILLPIDKLSVLIPTLVFAGLILAVSTVYVIKRRKD